MQNQGDFKLCASSTDVVKRFSVIKSVVIKRVHCTLMSINLKKDNCSQDEHLSIN